MTKASTDDYKFNVFKPHGLVEITSDSGVIFLTAVGPFNEVIVSAINAIQSEVIEEVLQSNSSWSQIVTFKKSCMDTHEALDKLKEYLLNLSDNNMAPLKTAFIITEDVEGQCFAQALYESIYEKVGLNMLICSEMVEAKLWLETP